MLKCGQLKGLPVCTSLSAFETILFALIAVCMGMTKPLYGCEVADALFQMTHVTGFRQCLCMQYEMQFHKKAGALLPHITLTSIGSHSTGSHFGLRRTCYQHAIDMQAFVIACAWAYASIKSGSPEPMLGPKPCVRRGKGHGVPTAADGSAAASASGPPSPPQCKPGMGGQRLHGRATICTCSCWLLG